MSTILGHISLRDYPLTSGAWRGARECGSKPSPQLGASGSRSRSSTRMRIAKGWCFCNASHLRDSAGGCPGLPGARRPARRSLCVVFCILSVADAERGAQSSERTRDLPEFAQPVTKLGSISGACVLDSSLKVGPGRGDPGSPHLTGLPGRKEVNESILWIRPDPNLGTSRVSPPIKGTGPHLVGSGIQCVLGVLGHFEPPRSLIPAPSCCPSHLSTRLQASTREIKGNETRACRWPKVRRRPVTDGARR